MYGEKTMPFVKDDPNINRKGRGTGESLINPKSLSNAENREIDMRKTLRKLKPLNNKAISVLAKLLDDESTTEATKVKISVFIMKVYQEMMDDLDKPINNKASEDSDDEEFDNTPTVSFKVINGGN